MKILHGLYEPDEGEVRINGLTVHIESPRDAEQRGIAMIPQELDLFPDLSIAENLYIGRSRPRHWWGGFDWPKVNASASEVGRVTLPRSRVLPSHSAVHAFCVGARAPRKRVQG
jgi:ABC-type sugar transport system ATPase subunit